MKNLLLSMVGALALRDGVWLILDWPHPDERWTVRGALHLLVYLALAMLIFALL